MGVGSDRELTEFELNQLNLTELNLTETKLTKLKSAPYLANSFATCSAMR